MDNLIRRGIYIVLILQSFLCLSQENEPYIYISNTNIENHLFKNERHILMKDLENKIDDFIIYYENNGYPFAQIRLEKIDGNTADLIVEKGEKYTIDSLAIYGNSNISEKQLYHIIGMKKGETYNQKKILKIEKRIGETNYLTQKKKYEFVFHKNTVDIYFYLEKEKNNFIDGLIGFSNQDNKININGFAKIKLQNLINKGEEVYINWNGDQKKFQKLESIINFPYLNHSKIGVKGRLNVYKQNNDFTNILTETGIFYHMNHESIIGINYQNKNSIVENENFSTSKQNNIGLEFRFNGSNSQYINLNGYFGKKRSLIPLIVNNHHSNHYSCNINSHNIKKINSHIRISLSTNSSLIFSEDLSVNELLLFGGSNSLTGFNENEFLANKYSITTTSFYYILEKSTAFSLFYQQAYFQKKLINENITSGWPRSIGAKIDLENKSSIIYIQYAIGISKNQNFNFQNGKIYLGIQNRF